MARRGQDDVYTHSSCPYLDGTRPLNTGLGSVISVLFMLRCVFALETKTASKRHCAATGLAMEIIHRGLREHSNALAGTIGQPAPDTGCSPPLQRTLDGVRRRTMEVALWLPWSAGPCRTPHHLPNVDEIPILVLLTIAGAAAV